MFPVERPEEPKPVAVLKRWWIESQIWDGYKAPEQLRSYLVGEVYNHPNERHFDGKIVKTSEIISSNQIEEWSTVETINTIYLLENMCPKYKEWLREHRRLGL